MKRVPEKIVVATRNAGKVRELAELAQGLPITFLNLNDFTGIPDVTEDGLTFEENALKKARETFACTGIPSLADDSGLCVDALDGRPGVFSARYSGDDVSDTDRYMKILEELEGVDDVARGAKFVCVLALVSGPDDETVFRGECAGRIIAEPRGYNGFGYDPIFLYEPSGVTFAEMTADEKNLVSHRADAMKKLFQELKKLSLNP